MSFLCKQISDKRWGIYSGTRLLATVSDRATCEAIMANFQSARREMSAARNGLKPSVKKAASKASAFNVSESIKAAIATENATQSVVVSGGAAAGKAASSMMSDDDLARVLNLNSLKVKELESAVLWAQRSQTEKRS